MSFSCFVISPLGTKDATFVLKEIIKPACKSNYKVIGADEEVMIRGDKQIKVPKTKDNDMEAGIGSISDRVFNNLENADIVIAYLGSPQKGNGNDKKWYWNGNVMLEAGYRMGLRKPIVFVRAGRENEEIEPLLPFDIQNRTVVELLKKEYSDDYDALEKKRKEIRDCCDKFIPLILTSRDEMKERHAWPAITLWFREGGGTVIGASKAAKELFGIEQLTGMNLNEVINKIKAKMPKKQAENFENEQSKMLGELMRGQIPRAKVCMVFSKQTLSAGDEIPNAWLPVISSYNKDITPWEVTVLYYDVKENATFYDGIVRL
ncbi:MAG: hypothetical protein HUU08_06580 [Candidatus Brocadia sp.]|nr:hypothetical protein [Candidatus Brocadia sp.]